MTGALSDYERTVVDSWTGTHKKSTLVLFVLLALSQRPRWSGELHAFIQELSDDHLGVDAQSLHRALRRLDQLNVITHTARPAPGTGANRKVFQLTASGHRVLAAYRATTLSYLDHDAFRELLHAVPDPDAEATRATP